MVSLELESGALFDVSFRCVSALEYFLSLLHVDEKLSHTGFVEFEALGIETRDALKRLAEQVERRPCAARAEPPASANPSAEGRALMIAARCCWSLLRATSVGLPLHR